MAGDFHSIFDNPYIAPRTPRLCENLPACSAGFIQSDLTAALMDGNAASSAGATYLDSARYFMAIGL
ncbi:MAG: hypothetical protein GY815_02685 [Gammaproteobacteria bacterium]|nr:hypothetical protein [Gammaproteobacteria bacterium]